MLSSKLERLRELLVANTPMLIAYSGGVDSSFLLAIAQQTIPGKFSAVIADSPSLPRAALNEALAFAEKWEIPLTVLNTKELDNPEYQANPANRCYYCKAELFDQMQRLALEGNFQALAYGENADDARQDRPGRQAAATFQVIAPLCLAGLTKLDIREASKQLELPTAEAPSQPCLSSRIPFGTPVTREALAMIEAGEALVRKFGFRIFRVRYLSGKALVQIAPEEMHRLKEQKTELLEGLRKLGFLEVDIDPAGYQGPGVT